MKYGKFSIPRALIEDNLAKYVYRNTVPVRVEMDYCTDALEVTAIADWFEDLEPGQKTPHYAYELKFDECETTDITGVVTGGRLIYRTIEWHKLEHSVER